MSLLSPNGKLLRSRGNKITLSKFRLAPLHKICTWKKSSKDIFWGKNISTFKTRLLLSFIENGLKLISFYDWELAIWKKRIGRYCLLSRSQKSAFSFKTGTLEKRVEYAVEDSSFWLSKCYLCRVRGHEANVFPVYSSSDFLWFLTEFDLWSSLGNSMTSFET